MLDQDTLKKLFYYNPDTGIFTRKIATSNAVRVGDIAGYLNKSGYLTIWIDGRNYRAHRLAWLYVHGVFPEDQIDHINQDRSDNRIANLRCASNAENGRNARKCRRNTSGITGVYWSKPRKKWVAQIMGEGKVRNLGGFSDMEDAIAARKKAEAKYGFHTNHGRPRVPPL